MSVRCSARGDQPGTGGGQCPAALCGVPHVVEQLLVLGARNDVQAAHRVHVSVDVHVAGREVARWAGTARPELIQRLASVDDHTCAGGEDVEALSR